MIKITNIETWGWRHAIRGMRNPLNSWDKSDSFNCTDKGCLECPVYEKDRICPYQLKFIIGKNDLRKGSCPERAEEAVPGWH